MPADDPEIGRAQRARGVDVLQPAGEQHLTAHEAGHARPADDADDDEHDW